MVEFLISLILISAISMSGIRRIRVLNKGFAIQSFLIALIFSFKGYETNEKSYYVLFILTLLFKVSIIPYIINRAVRNLKINREIEFIINIFWSYILIGVTIGMIYAYLIDVSSLFIKSGFVLIIVGAILLIGRKKAITQMIGLLTLENGVVLIEVSMIKMSMIIEFGIIFELLVLALIMGVLVFKINKTFDTINTDCLSNLKE